MPMRLTAPPGLPRRRRQAHIEPQLREPGGAGTGTPFVAFVPGAVADGPGTARPGAVGPAPAGPGPHGPGPAGAVPNGGGPRSAGPNGPVANGSGSHGPGTNGAGTDGPGANGSGANGSSTGGPGANGSDPAGRRAGPPDHRPDAEAAVRRAAAGARAATFRAGTRREPQPRT